MPTAANAWGIDTASNNGDISVDANATIDVLTYGADYDAYGIEPVEALRQAAMAAHPELAGRLGEGGLPRTGDAFGGEFDGILCSAVLMHVPDTDLLDAALAIRRLLKPGAEVVKLVVA